MMARRPDSPSSKLWTCSNLGGLSTRKCPPSATRPVKAFPCEKAPPTALRFLAICVRSTSLLPVFVESCTRTISEKLCDCASRRTSIEVENNDTDKVAFEPFQGVAPHRYRDLFEKGKRKHTGGVAQQWNQGQRMPMIEVYYPSYFQAETTIVGELKAGIEELMDRSNTEPGS